MADYNFITNRGVIVADTANTRAQVEAEFKAAFGDDLPTDPSTPQGALITRIIEERDAIARNNAELANQINPALSGGIFLDGLSSLTGAQRRERVKSVISGAVFAGVPGTIIPAGSLAETETGDRFETIGNVILADDGRATGSLRALEYGPVPAPVDSLTRVASSVLGWETITNPVAAIVGTVEQSDTRLRRLRANTLALQTTSINEAIVSRLYSIKSVRSVYYLENYDDQDHVIEGIAMRKHSLWACVEGGTDQEVAQALFETKTVGGGYNGEIVVSVTDPSNGRQYPISFDRPVDVPILMRITVKQNSLDLQSLIPDFVMNYVNGELDGDVSFVVGADVSPFEIAGAINQQEPSIFVKKVELATVGGAWSSNTMDIAVNQVARAQIGSITVVIE